MQVPHLHHHVAALAVVLMSITAFLLIPYILVGHVQKHLNADNWGGIARLDLP